MKKIKTPFKLIIPIILILSICIGVTFAMMGQSVEKENLFQIGNVEVSLTEPNWNPDYDSDGDGVNDMMSQIVPSQTITKDPTITNTGDNNAYAYMMVEIPKIYFANVVNDNGVITTESHYPLFDFTSNDGWVLVDSQVKNTSDAYDYYLFAYKEPLKPGESATLFNSVTFANIASEFVHALTNEDIEKAKIGITGYAIQSEFYGNEATGPETAWNLYVNQNNWMWPYNPYEGKMSFMQNSSVMSFVYSPLSVTQIPNGSAIISAGPDGNVWAEKTVTIPVTTKSNVEQLKVVNTTNNTEEIWTKENSVVTDNKDGTITWEKEYEFEEKTYEFTVDAMVTSSWQENPTLFSFEATSKSVEISTLIVGIGKTVIEYSGCNTPLENISLNKIKIPYGSIATITAKTSVNDCEFYYWVDNKADNVIASAPVLKFVATSSTSLSVLFSDSRTKDGENKLVLYTDKEGGIIDYFDATSSSDIESVVAPDVTGYNFTNWSMTPDEAMESTDDVVLIKAEYEPSKKYDVNVTAGSCAVDSEGAYAKISTPLAKDGQQFAYWIDADTGHIVSRENSVVLKIIRDCKFTPVYIDSTVADDPVVYIQGAEKTENKVINGYAKTWSSYLKVYVNWYIPEDYKIVNRGILCSSPNVYNDNPDGFTVENYSSASQWFYEDGYGYAFNTTSDTTLYVRAYMTCINSAGEIEYIYSPILTYDFEE